MLSKKHIKLPFSKLLRKSKMHKIRIKLGVDIQFVRIWKIPNVEYRKQNHRDQKRRTRRNRQKFTGFKI